MLAIAPMGKAAFLLLKKLKNAAAFETGLPHESLHAHEKAFLAAKKRVNQSCELVLEG